MKTETETCIEYKDRSITPKCFDSATKEYRLLCCTATENLILPYHTKIYGGRYSNLFVGTLEQEPPETQRYDIKLKATGADCIRIGPYGRIELNGEPVAVNKIDRCICKGTIYDCTLTNFKRLYVLEGAIVHLTDYVNVDEIMIKRGTVIVHDTYTVSFQKTIDLHPGGIIKFDEIQETPHLDVVTSREKRTYREPTDGGREYTVIIG
jgi:hypothetical protein